MRSEFPESGPPPWHDADLSYVGWVPTILGHLSFSMIGVKGRWSHQKSFNTLNAEKDRRIVATHEYRVSQDYPTWNWLTKILKPSANQHYILLGKTGTAAVPFVESKSVRHLTDTQGVLHGVVYVLPWQVDPERRWECERLVKSITQKLDYNAKRSVETAFEVERGVKEYFNNGNLVHKFNFALFRTGELRIWSNFEDALGYQKPEVLSASELVIVERLPRQIYYFIKDSTHSHYHHERQSDQLLPLVCQEKVVGEDQNTHASNELSWRREVLWGLARVIARYRREGDITQLKRALGILAYADAFQATLGRVKRPCTLDGQSEYDDDITTYDFAHTKQSLASLDGLRTWSNAGNLQIFAAMFALIFSASSFWGASVKVAESACKSKFALQLGNGCENLVSLNASIASIWVTSHPLVFFGYLAMPVILAYSFFVKDINTFRILKSPSNLVSWFAKAIGVEVERFFSNARTGFAASVLFLTLSSYFFINLMIKIGNEMQSPH